MEVTFSNFERSKEFYLKALAPLSYTLKMEHGISGAGFGRDNKPNFWIQAKPNIAPIHVAFSNANRTVVDAFYKAALEAGGQDLNWNVRF